MYIVIDKGTDGSWNHATIVTDEDGNNMVFGSLEDAQIEADNCQDGVIIGDKDSFVLSRNINRRDTANVIGEAIISLVEYFKKFK